MWQVPQASLMEAQSKEVEFMFPPGAVCSHKAISFLSLLEGIVKFLLTWGGSGQCLHSTKPCARMAAFHKCSPKNVVHYRRGGQT